MGAVPADGRGCSTPADVNALVLTYLPQIGAAAVRTWAAHSVIQWWVGSADDARQAAVLYCLTVGARYCAAAAAVAPGAYWYAKGREGVWAAARNALRRRRGLAERSVLEPWPAGVDPGDVLDDGDFTAGVLDRLEVAQALGVLTPAERQVMVLQHGLDGVGGRSCAEMAEQLGISPRQVQALVARALARLRERFRVDGCDD